MRKPTCVHICSFQEGPVVGTLLAYEGFRKAVLKAGRFSVFEATVNQRTARMYDRLAKDPKVVLDHEAEGFPWTVVREVPDAEARFETAGIKIREVWNRYCTVDEENEAWSELRLAEIERLRSMKHPFQSNGCKGVNALCRRAVGLILAALTAAWIIFTSLGRI